MLNNSLSLSQGITQNSCQNIKNKHFLVVVCQLKKKGLVIIIIIIIIKLTY